MQPRGLAIGETGRPEWASSERDFPMRRAQQEVTRGALRELGGLP
jgi:hypothetical protein